MPYGQHPNLPQLGRQPAVKSMSQQIFFFCVNMWSGLAILSQAELQICAKVTVSALSTGVRMGAGPTLWALQHCGICFAFKVRHDPSLPGALFRGLHSMMFLAMAVQSAVQT